MYMHNKGQVRGCIKSCLPHNALHLRYQYTTHLLISLMSSTDLVIWSDMGNREWGSSDLTQLRTYISVCMDIYIYISTEVIHVYRQQTCNAIAQEGCKDGSDKNHRKKMPYSGIGRGWCHATIVTNLVITGVGIWGYYGCMPSPALNWLNRAFRFCDFWHTIPISCFTGFYCVQQHGSKINFTS